MEQKEMATSAKRRRPWWLRLLKWTGITVSVLIVLFLVVMSLVVWILTPERLTPIVTGVAREYLNADVNAERVELTFWSTFPKLQVDVDNMEIVSKRLQELPHAVRDSLPQYADSLFAIRRFSAGINVLGLATGNISLYDVILSQPRLNLVAVNDSVANYDIVPPSEEEEEDGGTTVMPGVSINRFAIEGDFPVRYCSLADSIDFTVTLADSHLGGKDAPVYDLAIEGAAGGKAGILEMLPVRFGLNGSVEWHQLNPTEVRLKDFDVTAGEVGVKFNAMIAANDTLTVHELDIEVPELAVSKVVDLIPQQYRGELVNLDTDLTVYLKARLLKPYLPAKSELPVLDAQMRLAAKHLDYDRLHLNRIVADVSAMIDGADLDRSTIDVKRLNVVGRAMDFDLSGTVRTPMSDPYVNGRFDGGIAFDRLPNVLLDKLPFELRGMLRGTADVQLRQSYLTPKKFHKVKIDGTLTLDDCHVDMRDNSMQAYLRRAEFRLGTRSSLTYNGAQVDSMLTASLTIDTVAFHGGGMHLAGRKLSAGVGTRNIAQSVDTTRINPIGANIKAELLTMLSDSDHVRMLLHDAVVGASLQRYNSDARSPLLKLDINADAIAYADKYNRASMRGGHAAMNLHPRGRRPMSARMQARYDSIAAAHPELSGDTLLVMTRRSMRRSHRTDTLPARENMDFGVDNSVKSWLRLWQAEGTFTVNRARVFTPYFPLRNRLDSVDLSFSTDSVVLHHARYTVGRSDFKLNGAVRNISRAITSRRGLPVVLDFDMSSDTIDINEITAALMRGAVFADKLNAGEIHHIAESGSDEHIQASVESQVSADERAAFVVPANVTANFRMRARRILYNDIWLRRFEGLVSVYDGAVNLDRLRARTDIGTMNLTALYSAPNKDDMRFAAGLNISRLDLREFLNMIPQIDTIMPLLKEVEGIVTAEAAITSELDSLMNLKFNTIDLALKLSGDSLVLLDSETFRTLAKWMLFKQKNRNMIDRMEVEMTVHDGWLDLYPFVFDMDRYKLGVRGSNDMDLNLDYHVAVLKSPLPFKFGINIKGTPDNMKIRLGKARINEKSVASTRRITDTVRVNLMHEIERLFKRGVRKAGVKGLQTGIKRDAVAISTESALSDTISHADSLILIRQGIMQAPEGFVMPDSTATMPQGSKKKKRKT